MDPKVHRELAKVFFYFANGLKKIRFVYPAIFT